MRKLILGLAITYLGIACSSSHQNTTSNEPREHIFADSLKKHVAILASDSFLGRKPFTLGETYTIQYLQTKFKQYGLLPANKNSYLQQVPLVHLTTEADKLMQVQSPSKQFTLKAFDDYVVWTDKTDPYINIQQTDIVFAGYGVVAPEYGWNDYAGVDVKNKIVMVLVNDPGFWNNDTTLFKGKTMTYYGRWTYKFEEAARQGAKGCLIVHNTKAAGYPFSVPQNNFNTSRFQLDERGKNIPHCDMVGWITEQAATTLLKEAGYSSEAFITANKKGFKAFPLQLKASTGIKVYAQFHQSNNVVAYIPGTKRANEYIIYSAHWDHLGVGRPDAKGDSIYNGAVDNASGTAALLELARAFKQQKPRPERSIVFIALTAEEQGLLGSAYYAQNPIFEPENTVANINMDALNPFYATNDITIVGQGQSTVEDYFINEVKLAGRYVSPDPHPEVGSYYRSDHFNFAKIGIPALDTKRGIDIKGKGKEFGQFLMDDYTSNFYHKPSDEFNNYSWIMQATVQDVELLFRVGRKLAMETTWPSWKEGSEFKAYRKR